MINNPPYIITEVFTEIVAAISVKLNNVLNTNVHSYYGYIEEVNSTLMQMNKSPDHFDKKYPLIWLKQPFTISSGLNTIYGKAEDLEMFIIASSDANYKAKDRMEKIYKPILYPILKELFTEMAKHKAFLGYQVDQKFKITDRYFWGESQKSVLNDVCDTIHVRFTDVKINNKKNNCK